MSGADVARATTISRFRHVIFKCNKTEDVGTALMLQSFMLFSVKFRVWFRSLDWDSAYGDLLPLPFFP